MPPTTPSSTPDEPIGALVHRLSEQIPELVRSELRLAQVELTEKGKKAGIGIGLFSAAGVLGLFAFGTLIATVILALVALGLAPWLSALIVLVVLLAAAGIAAMVGKKEVQQATPAAPERTLAGVQKDKAAIKGEHV